MWENEFRLYQRKVLEELSDELAVINENQIRIEELEYCNLQLEKQISITGMSCSSTPTAMHIMFQGHIGIASLIRVARLYAATILEKNSTNTISRI